MICMIHPIAYVGCNYCPCPLPASCVTWWRHQMETFSALLTICAGNSPVPGEFPTQRPVTRSFDVFFDLRLNKRLGKQSWGWWLGTLSRPLWRHHSDILHGNVLQAMNGVCCHKTPMFTRVTASLSLTEPTTQTAPTATLIDRLRSNPRHWYPDRD